MELKINDVVIANITEELGEKIKSFGKYYKPGTINNINISFPEYFSRDVGSYGPPNVRQIFTDVTATLDFKIEFNRIIEHIQKLY